MKRNEGNNKNYFIEIKNINSLLCPFRKGRYAIKVCISVFFCRQKLIHCRSPPKSFRSKNELIGGNKNEIWGRFIYIRI